MVTLRNVVVCTLLSMAFACEGPRGPDGAKGDPGAQSDPGAKGDTGQVGSQGTRGCAGLSAGDPSGLSATVALSSPSNGQFFAPGEKPVITIKLSDRCGSLKAADLGTANLYVNGPRKGSMTKSANKLLNCVVDRAAADRQHHFVNLIAPKFADPTQVNLSEAVDGTLSYQLSAISDEAPGTYTVGLWAKTKDDKDQVFPMAEFQLGTATREEYASGPTATSTCYDCHKGTMSGKSYQIHIVPGRSPVGNYALDQFPIAGCESCHNRDGYSENPIVRKVHAVHRGEHQVSSGVAHPEYGLKTDTTLLEFMNVGFPSMPGMERDCTKCHSDDRWKSSPSRLACGTCHENVFFDTGTLNPPRTFGKPAAGVCTADTDCASFGGLATCNTISGACERKTHPVQSDDATCGTCHSADTTGLSPIPVKHEIFARTKVRGLQMLNLTLTGGSGVNGSFLVGDIPTLTFKLQDKAGTAVIDLKTNAALSGTALISGPTDNPQRVVAALTMKTAGTLSFDSVTGLYTYVFPAGLPANALAPLNTTGAGQVNASGTYTLWAYVNETLTVSGQQVRDAANAMQSFSFGANLPIRPRQVIAQAACDSCHVNVQAHGGSRQKAEGCFMCHTQGAQDRAVGSKGVACTVNAGCGGFAAGWEACQDTNADGLLDTCVMTADPTPNQAITFKTMIHSIHFARLRDGYSEMTNLVNPGKLTIIGYRNSANNFSEILFPQDIRNCTKCHADSGAACSATAPCGVGQACVAKKCVNVAYKSASSSVCLSCHDSASATAHAALMTYQPATGAAIESCEVCHGVDAAFSVEKVHNISSPYVPPYPREPIVP